jgi:hypothetical protein
MKKILLFLFPKTIQNIVDAIIKHLSDLKEIHDYWDKEYEEHYRVCDSTYIPETDEESML